ncbi:elongation factor TS-domain-containing protein [Fimicolochytrium jonesii]|uniref:elongation factor TS-domain-containing protein n=1 Tax=Fimicolochytrium jonesii TaxID=1396493 RepID=UPI0022FE03B1|nr:elongation factor TS-domain-containing protein [Fimicolochytrium jonesii]KAI8825247.1 elongation factor TS-domain-containing protein [Fimicolochytrium jonesii]
MFLRPALHRALTRSTRHCPAHPKLFTTTAPTLATSPTVKLVARLRKETQCSISKAREALAAVPSTSSDHYASALAWLEADQAASGRKKAAKLDGRVAAEGLVHVVGVDGGKRVAMVEVNAETDFVARSGDFVGLVDGVGASVLFAEIAGGKGVVRQLDVEDVNAAPAWPSSRSAETIPGGETVRETVVAAIGKLGENIRVRRAVVTRFPGEEDATATTSATDSKEVYVAGGYAHSGGDSVIPPGFGRIAAVAVLKIANNNPQLSTETRTKLHRLAAQIAQHVVGFSPATIAPVSAPGPSDSARDPEDTETTSTALLTQPFLFGGGTVQEVLARNATELGLATQDQLAVHDFLRWECGEGIEKNETDFAEEVKKQAGLA